MKFNEETMNVALEKFMKDDFWRRMYENAPEMAKKRLRVAFWGSTYMKEDEDIDPYREYREQVESEMTYEDAAYLAKEFPEGAGKKHYAELRDDIENRVLKTDDKLDEACEIMLEGASARDREAYERTKTLLKNANDPFIKYEWLWSAVGGNSEDCEMLGDIMDHGHGVEPDEDLAFYWFRKAAMCGCPDSCSRLAAIYEREESPRFDMSRALFWYREALRRNSIEAKVDLAARMTTWEGGVWEKMRNPELGFEMLKNAYNKGNKRAAFYLGACYEKGVGVKRNLVIALRYYTFAAEGDVYGADEACERVRELRKQEKGK